nr:hypothetical protein [uncultured Mucilaginibacter sp.]
MQPELITYQKFNDPGLADELATLLQQNDIIYKIEEQSFSFNPTFYADETAKDYAVKISADDFGRVNELLQAESAEEIKEVDEEHYLFKFTNEELRDLIAKRDEWSAFDYQLAIKILNERGISMDEQAIAELNEQRLEELKQTEPPQTTWIILGYIMAALGGVLGTLVGWHLFNYKKTLPNGEKVYGYSEADQKQGRIIFYLSFVGIALAIYFRLSRDV